MIDESPKNDLGASGDSCYAAKLVLQQLLEFTLAQMMVYKHGCPASSSKVAFAAQSYALFQDNEFDPLAVAGALGSAVSELENSLEQTTEQEFDRAKLCASLVRLAYNRMQRRRRQDHKFSSATMRSPLIDTCPSSKINQEISSFYEHIEEVIDIVLGTMPEKERQAVLLRLSGETQTSVAKSLGISRVAVQRIERRFAELARQTMDR